MNHHALIIGKFYPPHRGHHTLIHAALQNAHRVTVIAMSSAAESLPLAHRIAALRAAHPTAHITGIPCDAPLDLHDPNVWTAQIALMQAALRPITTEPIDLVVTGGDPYGPELAHRFQATHLVVPRSPDEPSGTAIRANLAAHWPALPPSTRAILATRIVFVGAESTGTTTISRAVADHYRRLWPATQWVPEYGRDYTEIKWNALNRAIPLDQLIWTPEDFDHVAHEQTRRENELAATGSPILLCDTDALATTLWERRYLGPHARPNPPYAAALPRHHLYLLTDHTEVPWHNDGMREGDLAIRAAMTTWFQDTLTQRNQSWVFLTGTGQQRTQLAIRSIDTLLHQRLRFTHPLTGPGFGQ